MALDRDVIFLAESGEEADPAGVGIAFMVSQHFDEIDAEFALAEGGGRDARRRPRDPDRRSRPREKVPRRFRLVATGTSGHGSVPRLDNPLTHLSAAVAKIGAFETPMRLNETTRAYFGKLAEIAPPEGAAALPPALERAAAGRRSSAISPSASRSIIRCCAPRIVPTILRRPASDRT